MADTKLKRRPHPKHVLQLVLYSDLLTDIQGVAPEFAHVELGDGSYVSEPARAMIEMLPNPMSEDGARVLELRGEGIRYGFRRSKS